MSYFKNKTFWQELNFEFWKILTLPGNLTFKKLRKNNFWWEFNFEIHMKSVC